MDYMAFFAAWLNPSYIPFLAIIIIMAMILYRAHISSAEKFNLYDTISDSTTGRASLEKILMLTGGLAVTWWFMDLAAIHKATWQDAVAYGGLLGLAKVADKLITAKYKAAPKAKEVATKE